mgnify:FL=1
MVDLDKAKVVINSHASKALEYLQDGFNLHESKSKKTLTDTLHNSSTDMGEERTFEDFKIQSKEDGWKFNNWNVRLALLDYVFHNISIVSSDDLQGELSVNGFDKNLMSGKIDLHEDDEEWWLGRGCYEWDLMCVRSSLFAEMVGKLIYLEINEYSLETLFIDRLMEHLTKIKYPDIDEFNDYSDRINFIGKNKNDLKFNALLNLELGYMKMVLERYK